MQPVIRAYRWVTPGRLSGPLALLALFAAFNFGAATRVAVGAHNHDYAINCGVPSVPHGLWHGDSMTDGGFAARVYGGTCGYNKSCDAIHANTGLGGTSTQGVDVTCNHHAFYQSECADKANVQAKSPNGVYFVTNHTHSAHNNCF